MRDTRALDDVPVRLGPGTLTMRVGLIVALMVAALGVVLATVWLSFQEVDRSSRARAAVDRAAQVTDDTRSAVLDMETGLRGFGLARDRRFLEPYFAGRSAFQRNAALLQRLTRSLGR